MILFIMSLGVWKLCFLHIIIHAFFKSILFLGTGSMMGQVGGLQDSRFYGVGPFIYFSYVYFLVSCFCLSGFPFFIGFYSKDVIIYSVSFMDGVFFITFLLVVVFLLLCIGFVCCIFLFFLFISFFVWFLLVKVFIFFFLFCLFFLSVF